MGRLFGTDGIRGIANVEITPELALALGRAVGEQLGGRSRTVLIGQDTRRSGEMLVAALGAGLASTGTDVVELGVVTTPCLVYLTNDGPAAGIMVYASHNPAPDNGLKVVVGGRKLDDEGEDELERRMAQPPIQPRPRNHELGRLRHDPSTVEAYRKYLTLAAGDAVAGLRIGLDCANGSASAIAPELFRALGAEVMVLFAAPDGSNINRDCGSTHPLRLAETVPVAGLDIGFAFDGDADRLIAVDERGELVDGDAVMGITALQRLAAGTLRNNLLVATVMSNGGLERAIQQAGGRMIRTPVGDRNVYEAMERHDAVLGGEQSGHVIFRELATTGDGLLTAIQLIHAMRAADDPLSRLADRIPRLPQVVLNSAARHRDGWEQVPEFAGAVSRAQDRLGERGRVLVRPSGTEPKIRIMVEGERPEEIDEIAHELARLAQTTLN
jgi:phosphoglucosamine mutase